MTKFVFSYLYLCIPPIALYLCIWIVLERSWFPYYCTCIHPDCQWTDLCNLFGHKSRAHNLMWYYWSVKTYLSDLNNNLCVKILRHGGTQIDAPSEHSVAVHHIRSKGWSPLRPNGCPYATHLIKLPICLHTFIDMSEITIPTKCGWTSWIAHPS